MRTRLHERFSHSPIARHRGSEPAARGVRCRAGAGPARQCDWASHGQVEPGGSDRRLGAGRGNEPAGTHQPRRALHDHQRAGWPVSGAGPADRVRDRDQSGERQRRSGRHRGLCAHPGGCAAGCRHRLGDGARTAQARERQQCRDDRRLQDRPGSNARERSGPAQLARSRRGGNAERRDHRDGVPHPHPRRDQPVASQRADHRGGRRPRGQRPQRRRRSRRLGRPGAVASQRPEPRGLGVGRGGERAVCRGAVRHGRRERRDPDPYQAGAARAHQVDRLQRGRDVE